MSESIEKVVSLNIPDYYDLWFGLFARCCLCIGSRLQFVRYKGLSPRKKTDHLKKNKESKDQINYLVLQENDRGLCFSLK